MDESESPSWKGHGFTLLVFGGIVVLCSIFFVLGMLVGRNQGQRIAENAAGDATRKTAAQPLPEAQPLKFFEQTTEPVPDDTLQPRPTPPTTSEGVVPAPAPPEPDPPALKEPGADKPYLQITATASSVAANDVLNKVRSKGFQARILPPGPASKDYRVWVGPYDTLAEAEVAKKELQAQGYTDVFRK